MGKTATTNLLGLNFCKQISPLITSDAIGFPKPNHYHLTAVSTFNFAMDHPQFKDILNSGVVICDSKPIFLTLKILKNSVEMIRGTDFMRCVLKSDPGLRNHFFIGSNSEKLFKLCEFISTNYPNVRIAGTFSPPFTDHENIINLILQNQELKTADIVWVGLGSPKQDYVAAEISKKLNVSAIGIGAAFDFLTGYAREAPRIFRLSGFEWFYRLIIEPKRLWRRYLFGNLKFIRLAFRAFMQSFR